MAQKTGFDDDPRKARLEAAVILFENSPRSVDDYMKFIYVVHNVLKQGSGLVWPQIEEVIREALLDENAITELTI